MAYRKLSNGDVIAILRYRGRVTQADLAKMFGVSQSTICEVQMQSIYRDAMPNLKAPARKRWLRRLE